MVRSILQFAPSNFEVVAILQRSPSLLLYLQSVLQIQSVTCHIRFWGRKMQRLKWWCPFDVLCNSVDMVWSPNHLQPCLFFSLFPSTSVHVESWSSFHSKSLFMSSSNLCIKNQPLSYCHMPCGWVPFFCCTYLVSNSPTLLRLRNRCLLSHCIYFYYMLCWSCHVAMLLTPKIRLRPKPFLLK